MNKKRMHALEMCLTLLEARPGMEGAQAEMVEAMEEVRAMMREEREKEKP